MTLPDAPREAVPVGEAEFGPWVATRNWAAARVGSIHDDATAREKGFPGGLVPGDVHVALLTRVLVDRFGSAWYEQGFMRHTFVKPVYNGQQVRAVVEPQPPLDCDKELVEWRVENRSGDVVTAGIAGLGTVAPWKRPDSPPPRPVGDYDPLPDEAIGFEYPERTPRVERDEMERSLEGNDDSEWYRDASPWGPPVVPTVGPFNLAHRIGNPDTPEPIAREMKAGMNAGFEVLHTGPMFLGRPYQRRAVLVEKGVSGRYAFRTLELTFDDTETGARVFTGRWRIKWVTSRP